MFQDLRRARLGSADPCCRVGHADRTCDRRTVARACDAAQSALLVFRAEFRTRSVSRILLVLLFQRAYPEVPEHAFPARLRHGAAPAVLGISFVVVVPVERVL